VDLFLGHHAKFRRIFLDHPDTFAADPIP